MTFWHVVTKFFDSGKVKVNLAPIEADCKPENHMSENKTCGECRQERQPVYPGPDSEGDRQR